MKLAIRTSSGPYAVGLFDHGGSLLTARQAAGVGPRQISLGGLLQECLEEIGHKIDVLSEVLVDIGPGGLSSTRAGVSFANAISFGRRLRLFGVSALSMQMYDVRTKCDLPVLSMRPAPGGQSIWAVFEESELTTKGCSYPTEAIEQQRKAFGRLSVVGPLKRLNLDIECIDECIFDIDPPSLESILNSPRRPPQQKYDIRILEPINSIKGV